MLQEAVLVKKDIVKIILTAVLMLLLVNCFDRPEKSKKSSSYKNEESEVLTDNNYYREQEVTEPMLFDYANLNYQSSTYDEETNTLVMKYVETNEKEGDDDYSIRAYEGKRKFKADIKAKQNIYRMMIFIIQSIRSESLFLITHSLYLKYPETMPRIQSGVLQDHL